MKDSQPPAGAADPFNLERFVQAQAAVYPSVLRELQNGRKTTHWMWFVFPQLRGLGFSPTSQRFALSGREEARHYLSHPLLGARLVDCTRTVLGHPGRSASAIFGSPDDMKLRSCMTLFETVPGTNPVFAQVLDQFYDGKRDAKTRSLLGEA